MGESKLSSLGNNLGDLGLLVGPGRTKVEVSSSGLFSFSMVSSACSNAVVEGICFGE